MSGSRDGEAAGGDDAMRVRSFFEWLEQGSFVATPIEGEFETWLRRAVEPFLEWAALAHMDLACAVDDALPDAIAFDPLPVRQALSCLLDEAFARSVAGRVDVRAYRVDLHPRCGACVRFEVSMSQPRWVPAGGSGPIAGPPRCGARRLSLALCRYLVARARGRMGSRGAPGQGLTLWFE
ncbi:MAG: hypothetical protein KGO01_20870, partial [Burkholderiales bacterium]|nr:hypothetical protein [Burkholderiales bacterium]